MEIKRNRYLERLISRMNNGMIKVVTGIRRCGKTYLLFHLFYDYLVQSGVPEDNIDVIHVPGAVELTYGAARILREERVNALVVIGCVIQGDTPHFDYVCQSVTQGVAFLNAQGKVPVIFSVLTVLNKQQALDRCGGKLGNKGIEGAVTAIRMANL